MLRLLINLKHLRENRYEIRFFLEIADDVVAKHPVMQGKHFFTALQELQNPTRLILGQDPNDLQRMKSGAGTRDEGIERIPSFRFIFYLA